MDLNFHLLMHLYHSSDGSGIPGTLATRREYPLSETQVQPRVPHTHIDTLIYT